MITDYGDIIGDSFEYAKEALWGKWMKWLLLIVSTIIFPLILGYTVRIYRGITPAPELVHRFPINNTINSMTTHL